MVLFLLMVAILVFMILLNVPIAIAIGIPAILLLLIKGVPQEVIPLTIFHSSLSFPLLAIPLFMFIGAVMGKAKLADYLIDFASALVGWMKGGLAMVNVVDSMFFGGISGATSADVASTGPIIIPQMIRKGYPRDFSVALTSFTATSSLIIPPSIDMIIYGVLAQVSISKLFIAGIVPGIILGLGSMVLCYFFTKKFNYPVDEAFELKKLGQTFVRTSPALSLPIIILGGILAGIFTVTESAAVGAVVTLCLGLFVYRNLNLQKINEALLEAGRRTSIIMLLISVSGVFGWFLANEQIPQQMTLSLLNLTDNRYVILLILNVFLAFLGCFISGAAIQVILVPILAPVIRNLGIDPLHFGIIMVLNVDMGTQTPPVGATMLLACVIGKASIGEVWKVNKYFIAWGYTLILLITYVPSICLWLPSFMH